MTDCASSLPDEPCIPPELLEELDKTVTTLFERAIVACDASSNLERIEKLRASLRDQINSTLARPLRVHNALLSLQHCLPAELWLEVWMRLPLSGRVALSHVCSHWRSLIVQSPNIWTTIDCFAFTWTAPDGTSCHRSTASLVPLALERAKGLELSLTFSLDHDAFLTNLRRFVELLAPHARSIVGIDLTGTSQQFRLILQLLQPMCHIEWVVHSAPTFESFTPGWPPILAVEGILPELKLLVLPYSQPYGWSDYPYDYDTAVPIVEARFPTIQRLCLSPARDWDIARALLDCPIVSSLTLVLGTQFHVQSQYLEMPQLSSNHLTHLYLLEVPLERLAWVFSTFSMSLKQFAVVYVLDTVPEIFSPGEPRHYIGVDWMYAPPSLLAPLNDEYDTRGTGRRSKATQLYRRMSLATRRIFRRTAADHNPPVIDAREPSPVPEAGPLRPSLAPTRLTTLGELFHGLCPLVDVLLVCRRTRDARGMEHFGAELVASDGAGRTRVAGLCYRHNVTTLLSCVWDTNLPLAHVSRLAVDFELFSAVVASLPDARRPSPPWNFSLLLESIPNARVTVSPRVPNEPSSAVALGTSERAVFPELRTLRFGPRDVNRAMRTLLRSEDIETFVNSLGCRIPLENLTLSRGVDVDDASALDAVALSVTFGADPTYWDPSVI